MAYTTASIDDVPRDDLIKIEVKEEIDEEKRLQRRSLVQQIHMQGVVAIVEKAESKKDESK